MKRLCISLSIIMAASISFGQYYDFACDTAQPGQHPTIDGVWSGNSSFFRLTITENGKVPALSNTWFLSFTYFYNQSDTNGGISISGVWTGTNVVVFSAPTPLFNEDYDDYYFSVFGTNTTHYSKTFCTGKMIEYYDPAAGMFPVLSQLRIMNWDTVSNIGNLPWLNYGGTNPVSPSAFSNLWQQVQDATNQVLADSNALHAVDVTLNAYITSTSNSLHAADTNEASVRNITDINLQSQITADKSSISNKMGAFSNAWRLVYSDGGTNKVELPIGVGYFRGFGPGVVPGFYGVTASATNVTLTSVLNAIGTNYVAMGQGTNLYMVSPATALALIGGQSTSTVLTILSTNISQYLKAVSETNGGFSASDVQGYGATELLSLYTGPGTTGRVTSTAGDAAKVLSGAGTWIDATGLGDMLAALNLSDVVNPAAARTNLGLNAVALITNACNDFGSGTVKVSNVMFYYLYDTNGNLLANSSGVGDWTFHGTVTITNTDSLFGTMTLGTLTDRVTHAVQYTETIGNATQAVYATTANVASSLVGVVSAGIVTQAGPVAVTSYQAFTNANIAQGGVNSLSNSAGMLAGNNAWTGTAGQNFQTGLQGTTGTFNFVHIGDIDGLIFGSGLSEGGGSACEFIQMLSNGHVYKTFNGSYMTNIDWMCFSVRTTNTLWSIGATQAINSAQIGTNTAAIAALNQVTNNAACLMFAVSNNVPATNWWWYCNVTSTMTLYPPEVPSLYQVATIEIDLPPPLTNSVGVYTDGVAKISGTISVPNSTVCGMSLFLTKYAGISNWVWSSTTNIVIQ